MLSVVAGRSVNNERLFVTCVKQNGDYVVKIYDNVKSSTDFVEATGSIAIRK